MLPHPCGLQKPLVWLAPRLGVGLALAVAADFLFLDASAAGLALALFLATLAAAAALFNMARPMREKLPALALLAAGLFTLLLEGGALNIALALLATTMFAISARRSFRLAALAPPALTLPLTGPFRLAADLWRVRRLTRFQRRMLSLASLVGWIVPIAVLFVFAGLLALGNPLFDQMFDALLNLRLDFASLARHGGVIGLALVAIWPLLHVRPAPAKKPARRPIGDGDSLLFGATPMARALVLLNLLFLAQGGSDIAFIWGGLTLPRGMSYADYAHQSAYPLAFTALLAAGFSLLALRPGGPSERSRWIAPLVLGFAAQNALLVCSAMFRLKLYVAAYGLTELRIAALIWMVLVAAGLGLIMVRIARGKSNSWLMEMNARALALALFVAATLNVPWIIGRYNLAHCKEMGGEGPHFDWSYLADLGPQALPALDAFLPLAPAETRSALLALRANLADRAERGDWRAWSWRSARLKTYLAETPVPTLSN